MDLSLICTNVRQNFIGIQAYRQLEIINQVFNTIVWYFLPIFTFIIVVVAALMGYMIIKMAGSIPHTLLILEILLSAVIFGGVLIEYPLMADVMEKSSNFLRILDLQGGSIHIKNSCVAADPSRFGLVRTFTFIKAQALGYLT